MNISAAVSAYLAQLDDQILLGDRQKTTREFYAYPLRNLERVIDRNQRERLPDVRCSDCGVDRPKAVPTCPACFSQTIVARTIELSALSPADLENAPPSTAFRRAARRLYTFQKLVPPAWLTVPPEGQCIRILSCAEYRRLRRAAVGQVPWMMALIRHTGMRPQEVRELQWGRVHEERRIVELWEFKSRSRRKDGLRIRTIPLPARACQFFARVRAERNPDPKDLVFCNRRGSAWKCQSLLCAVGRARHKAGLDKPGEHRSMRIRIYTLRHTFATDFLRGGGDVIMLGDILGHTRLDTTRLYCHPTDQDKVAAYDRAMGGGKPEISENAALTTIIQKLVAQLEARQ
jgi:hypothetical protein